jgi:hypothetical protein
LSCSIPFYRLFSVYCIKNVYDGRRQNKSVTENDTLYNIVLSVYRFAL